MALYHFSVSQIKRSSGSSAVASAAYRAGEKLHSERYDEYNDYTKKQGVLLAEILLPPHAPPEYADRQILWNAVEAAEKRNDAQLAYSFDIALQNEFSTEENMELARKFIEENFVARGMIADYAIHDPDREPGGIPNPHVHIMAPIRPLNPDGTWGEKQKKVPLFDDNGQPVWDEKHNRQKYNAVPTTDWGSPETLETWRQNWSDLCNQKFAEKGLVVRLDNRSYERQGVEQLPTIHEGPAVRAMEKKGIPTEKGEYNRWVRMTNALLRALRSKLSALAEWISEAKQELNQPKQLPLNQIITNYMQKQAEGAQSFNPYARRKAGITTVKDASEIVLYLQENGIATADQLQERLKNLMSLCSTLKESLREEQERIRILQNAIQAAGTYRENLPVYQEMEKPKYRFKVWKDRYMQAHAAELRSFQNARKTMRKAGMGKEYDPAMLAAWKKELKQLRKACEQDRDQLGPLWEEQKKVSHIRYIVDRVLDGQNMDHAGPEKNHRSER